MKILFFGTPAFAVPSLRALLDSAHEVVQVVAQPDKPAGRGMKLRKPPVAELALERSIPLEQPAKIRDDSFLERMRELKPELGVVVAYGRILPPALLEIPRHGFINVHASLLPKYRGAAPIQRAIEAGEEKTGVTIMRVDELLDHGPMFASAQLEIGGRETAGELSERLAELGGGLLAPVIARIDAGTANETPQNHDAATHAKKLEKREGEIDWTASSKAIFDRARAFDPWPGVFATIRGEAVRMIDLEASEEHAKGAPGEIAVMEGGSIVVACGKGALRIGRMQRPGKSPASASDLARGWGLAPGMPLR